MLLRPLLFRLLQLLKCFPFLAVVLVGCEMQWAPFPQLIRIRLSLSSSPPPPSHPQAHFIQPSTQQSLHALSSVPSDVTFASQGESFLRQSMGDWFPHDCTLKYVLHVRDSFFCHYLKNCFPPPLLLFLANDVFSKQQEIQTNKGQLKIGRVLISNQLVISGM